FRTSKKNWPYHISLKDFNVFERNKTGIFLTPHLFFFKKFGYIDSRKAIIYYCRIKPVDLFNPTRDRKKLLNYLLQNPYEFNKACNHNLLYWDQTIRLYLGYHLWQAGEHAWLIKALQNLHFDGYTVTESAIGNIAIFDPKNISITHKLYMKNHRAEDIEWDNPKPVAGKLYDYFLQYIEPDALYQKAKQYFTGIPA
ncbi:MAG: hypothetical protein LBB94_10440, partial [Clostridiales bacterium]|nr:hypothetical protein [Clostridiales bacterium]